MEDAVDIPMGSDKCDAGSFDFETNGDDLLFEGRETPELRSPPIHTSPKSPAGELLLSANRVVRKKSPTKLSAGELLISDSLKDNLEKLDYELVFKEEGSDSDGEEGSGFVFEAEKSSNSIKHFILNMTSTPAANHGGGDVPPKSSSDVTDAGGEKDPTWEDPTRPQRQESQICGAIPIGLHVSRDVEFKYKMNYKYRGCFVIFNQKKFEPHLNMEERKGTDKDAALLEDTARKLGFEYVKTFHDLSKKEIIDWVTQLGEYDHSDYDCFVCCILTHGNKNDVLYANDKSFKVKDLMDCLKPNVCPSLAGKPKLFFVQACRGYKLDHGAPKPTSYDRPDGPILGHDQVDSPKSDTIPVEADFLVGYSTVDDYYSWRNESNGSVFIQNLCMCWAQWGHSMEIMQIMARVNHMTAYDWESSVESAPHMNKKKQIPSVTYRLTAELYFTRKGQRVEVDHPSSTVSEPVVAAGDRLPLPRQCSELPETPTSSNNIATSSGPSNLYPPPLPPKKKKLTKISKLLSGAENFIPLTNAVRIPGVRKISYPTDQYSRSLEHPNFHKSETTPQIHMREPKNNGQVPLRRSFPGFRETDL